MLIKTKRIVLLGMCCLFSLHISAKVEKDPTKPPLPLLPQTAQANTHSKELVLSAVFTKGQHNYAIVNDRIMSQGDIIGGREILSIKENSIELQDITANDVPTTLNLHDTKNIVKRAIK
ncbi:hypothetical protein [Agaribacter flavus]|uniref:MSHA biogenesis protein MshK n=1 Tax=Agaribacter flavus TaxID=1902781 RepID=A0ABV7FSB3_9ALTE